MQRRLLFCSYHLYGDPSSGAALSARDLLESLAASGWDCRVLCGSMSDFEDRRPVESVLADQGIAFSRVDHRDERIPFSLLYYEQNRVPVTIFRPPGWSIPPDFPEGYGLIAALERILDREQPDVVLTYGGHWLGRAIIVAAKQRGLPVVFWLHNCEYPDARLFEPVDGIIVPSRYVREHYRQSLNLESTDIPPLIDRSRVQSTPADRRYVTFVNPHPAKGVFYFAGIAAEMFKRRPDIPLLVVQGRAEWLKRTGLDPATCLNLDVMANTTDPRNFYAVSKIVLMPSLWAEAFGRVAVEAMLNGLPVLASDRGGLPQILSDAGFIFPIPAGYTPYSTRVPSPAEVAGWVDTIIRLWDDPALYETERRRALAAAEQWAPADLIGRYEAALSKAMTQARRFEDESDEPVLQTVRKHIEQSHGKSTADALGRLTPATIDAMLAAAAAASREPALPPLPKLPARTTRED